MGLTAGEESVHAQSRASVLARPVVVAVLVGAAILAIGQPTAPAASGSGLVAAYGFNEGSGAVVADASGAGNNGSISNATWSSTGKFGAALSFAASRSAYVSVPSSSSLQLSSL